MLKSAGVTHFNQPLMSDEGTEEYITRLFAISPRAVRGTASAKEWLEFIDKYNEHDSHVVLNERQKKTIEPYCTINDDVEMTPDDFLKLIRIVRHETPPSPTLSRSANLLDDARPRSSRLVGNRPTPSFSSSARMRNARLNQQLSDTDDDKESLDHPDAESDDISLVSNTFERDYFRDEDDEIPYKNSTTSQERDLGGLERRAIQERERANQERERQKMIESIERDYIQRLELLGSQLDSAESDLKRHKSLLDDQNNKTKENEEKIAELEAYIGEYELNMEIQSKTQLRSRQELEKMTSKYTALEETHKLETMKSKQNENNLYQAKEEIKLLQKENTDHRDIYNQLQEQIRLAHVIQQDLEDEKSKLIEIIDIQKYDLDKANTGLTLDQETKEDPISLDELGTLRDDLNKATLATEQFEAMEKDYQERIQRLQDEIKQNKASFLNELKYIEKERDHLKMHETIKSTKDVPVQTETDDLLDELTMNNEKQSKVIHNILQHLDGRAETGFQRFPRYFIICACTYVSFKILFMLLFVVATYSGASVYPAPYGTIDFMKRAEFWLRYYLRDPQRLGR